MRVTVEPVICSIRGLAYQQVAKAGGKGPQSIFGVDVTDHEACVDDLYKEESSEGDHGSCSEACDSVSLSQDQIASLLATL